jgi:hypothetical protein
MIFLIGGFFSSISLSSISIIRGCNSGKEDLLLFLFKIAPIFFLKQDMISFKEEFQMIILNNQ